LPSIAALPLRRRATFGIRLRRRPVFYVQRFGCRTVLELVASAIAPDGRYPESVVKKYRLLARIVPI